VKDGSRALREPFASGLALTLDAHQLLELAGREVDDEDPPDRP